MNEAQRSVIQRHYRQLADDLIMTEELLGSFFQKKIFERAWIDLIKAEKTQTEQTYKMLSMLPKRGPEAFDLFVDIIKVDYPWLATMLDTSYRSETLSRQNSLICTCGNLKLAVITEPQSDLITPRPSVPDLTADPDIKTRVGTFIHKQFGQSKRISQIDKKSMEKWFSEQIQYERRRLKKKAPSTDDGIIETSERGSCTSPPPNLVQDDLKRVYNKVRDENCTDSQTAGKELDDEVDGGRSEDGSDDVDGANTDKLKDLSSVVVKLEEEIDTLINRLNAMEGLIIQCHYILGDQDKLHKLPTLVKDAQFVSKQLERELSKEKEKSEKMLTELYDYCKSINKLENLRQQQRLQMEKHSEEIEVLKGQNAILREKCQVLETANVQHLEKEKTLENLRKMVNDLKNNHNSLVDENTTMRMTGVGTQATRGYRRPLRIQNRRGSIVETNGMGTNFRKGTTKTTTNTTRRKPVNSRY